MKKNKEEHNKEDSGLLDEKQEQKTHAAAPAQKKEQEYKALWDKHLRLCAEFENTRKRWQKEKEEVIKFSNFLLLQELLVVLDEMEQAAKMIKQHKSGEEIIKGLDMMYNNFSRVLKKGGLKVIEAQGKDFDPHFHEIVATREAEDEQEHKVLEEVQKGYLLEGKVLRTSKVIVGIKKKSTVDSPSSIEEPKKDEEK